MRLPSVALPLLAGALTASALLGACTAVGGGAGAGDQTPAVPASVPPSTAGGPQVSNRAFISTVLTGHALVPGTRVTLRFRDGDLGANAGCNSMSGSYDIAGDMLNLSQLATTEMACQADLMAQDQWLAAFLPGATVSLDATGMTLAKEGVTMAMVDQQTMNLPLEGTYWVVDGLVAGDAVSSVPAGVNAILRFIEGRVEVRAGCNQGSGTAAVDAGRITFGPVALTKMACSADAMAVEQHVVAVLAGVQPYSIAGDSLQLGASGRDGLTLKGATPPATAPSDPGPT